MNESEILRSANTGKLLLHAMGSSHSKLYVSCMDDDENELRSVLQRTNAMVLFPSEDAIGVDEFLSTHHITADQPADIVILDSTWSGARYLRRRLEKMGIPVPFVCLSEATMIKFMEEGSPLSVMKKTRKDGMCTMEAFALLLSEMGQWEHISSDLIALADELQKKYFIESGKRLKRVDSDSDSWCKSDVRKRGGRAKNPPPSPSE
jgi:DTW domain-containing protein YfiP